MKLVVVFGGRVVVLGWIKEKLIKFEADHLQ